MEPRTATLVWFLLLLLPCDSGRDNQGQEFILMFLDNQITGTSNDLEIFITTMSNNHAKVNVTLPLHDPSFLLKASAQRNVITKVIIPYGVRGIGTGIENKGVWIQSDEEIVVFGVNKETYSTDAYQALPVDVLSTEYYALTGQKEALLGIVSTENNTSVNITLPEAPQGIYADITFNGVSYSYGQTITITLDRFETFHMTDMQYYADFTGCHVTSDKPVSVVCGNHKVAVPAGFGSSDHLTELVPPVNTLGKQFYTYSTPDRLVGDVIKIVAVEDDTSVTLSGGASFSLDAAKFKELNVATGDFQRIQSDKGILVGHFSKTHQGYSQDGPNGGDPALTFLLPRPQWAADYTYSTIRTPSNTVFTNYIVVHINPNEVDGLRLDQNNVTGVTWQSITGVTDMVLGVISVSDGSHNIYHIDPSVSFSAISTGVALFNSYAFATGSRMAAINEPCTADVSATVAGDIIDNDCDELIDEEISNGIDDDGDGLIDEDLASLPRVEGNWGSWTAWGSCSEQCEAVGNRTRIRQCDNPAPANGGQFCAGTGIELRTCNNTLVTCPVDGNWTTWSAWDNCTGTCGTGTQFRERNCTNPLPIAGGNYCPGSANETISCTLDQACASSDEVVFIAVGCAVGGLAFLAGLGASYFLILFVARKKISDDDEEEEEGEETEGEDLPECLKGPITARNVSLGGLPHCAVPPLGTNKVSPV